MVSDFLRAHSGVLSLSEFFCFVTDFGGRIAESFAPEPVDAAYTWRQIAGLHPKQTLMLRRGIAIPEVLWRRLDDDVPAILQTTLPHLTPNADVLLRELETFVGTLPTAPIAEHYARIFAWLRLRFGRRLWVERSGGSLRLVRRLASAFPDARFVHIVRDGRACALSMSRHLGFRMALVAMQLTEILGVDPFESDDRTGCSDVPDELARFLPETFDADAFRRYEVPLPLCGHYWSGEIVAGVLELSELPAERVLTLRYEDFLARPSDTATRLAGFLGADCDDRDWADAMAARVRAPSSSVSALDPATRRDLDAACRPGFEALGDVYPECGS